MLVASILHNQWVNVQYTFNHMSINICWVNKYIDIFLLCKFSAAYIFPKCSSLCGKCLQTLYKNSNDTRITIITVHGVTYKGFGLGLVKVLQQCYLYRVFSISMLYICAITWQH